MLTFQTFQTNQTRQFMKDVSQLIKAGLSMEKALSLLIKETQNQKFKKNIEHIYVNLTLGQSLQKNLQNLLPNTIPAHFADIAHIPRIDIFLDHLEQFLDKKIKQTQTLKKQLAYPSMLLLTLSLLGVGFCKIIAPTYSAFFQGSGLPVPRSIVMAQHALKYIQPSIIGIAFSIGSLSLHSPTRRKIVRFIQKYFFKDSPGELLWLLGILMKSGIPLNLALPALKLSPNNSLYPSFSQMRHITEQTGSLYLGIKASKLIPEKYQAMLLHAEKTQTLADRLIDVGHEILNDTHDKTIQQLAFVQPILLGIIGLCISAFSYISFVPILSSLQAF